MLVLSPTDGIIRDIKIAVNEYTKKEDKAITIYIHPYDNHDIYSPVKGIIEKIDFFSGTFVRPLFVSSEGKRGRLVIYIKGEQGVVSFWVEVGEGYITNSIELFCEKNSYVNAGDRIAKIIIGSLSEIHLPVNTQLLVEKEMSMTGGVTIVAEVI